jgi:hypothetical protein
MHVRSDAEVGKGTGLRCLLRSPLRLVYPPPVAFNGDRTFSRVMPVQLRHAWQDIKNGAGFVGDNRRDDALGRPAVMCGWARSSRRGNGDAGTDDRSRRRDRREAVGQLIGRHAGRMTSEKQL